MSREAESLRQDLQDILQACRHLPPEERLELAVVLRGWADSQADLAPVPEGGFPGQFGMIGDSASMQVVYDLLAKIVHAEATVLIAGETGTGKELVAKALHQHGPRRKGPFIAVNCAAIPATLLESEIFGHRKGAFTGAHQDRKGYADAAAGGTLFLDEIGEMPLELQSKLLRFLENGEVRPVGANLAHQVDVRMVAASNRDLLSRVKERAFREDLYYRLAVLVVDLPPLRERAGDLELLAHFILRQSAESGLPSGTLTGPAMEALGKHSWPGNVRELQNVLVRASAFCKDSEIKPEDLFPS